MRERTLAVGQHALDQNLGTAAGFLLSMQACLDDFGIVENEDVAWFDKRRQIDELAILDAAGVAVDVQQPTRRPRFGRMLRDQLLREVEIEISQLHIVQFRFAREITL